MQKFELAELLQQDIKDLQGLFEYKAHGLPKEQAKMLARGIIANLEDHVKELISE